MGKLPVTRTRRLNWSQWDRDLQVLYAEPLFRKATLAKHRQAAREAASCCPRPGGLDQLAVCRVVAHLSKTRRPRTVNSLLRCLRAQANLLVSQGHLRANPFSGRRMLVDDSESEPLSHHLAIADIARCLEQSDHEAGFAEPRRVIENNRPVVRMVAHEHPPVAAAAWGGRLWRARRRRALLYLIAFTGCRRGEALARPIADLDLADSTVRIRGRTKTKRSRRLLPIPPQAAEVLRGWVAELQAGPTTTPWLFPQSRRPERYWIGGRSVNRPTGDLRQLGERAGVCGLTPLALRHSFATHGRTAWGWSRDQLRDLMGHTTIDTQEWYCHDDMPNRKRTTSAINFRIVDAPPGDPDRQSKTG